MDDMRKHLHDLVDGESSPVSFDEVWRKADMPRKNKNASRRSGLWWAASGIAAAAVVAAIVLTQPPTTTNKHHTTPPPAAHHQGTTVGSSGAAIASPTFGSVTMTSSQTGWALVQQPSSTTAPVILARTTNQGSTWTDVTPSGATGSFAFDPVGPTTAYVAAIQPTQSVTVYVTTDGGKSWTHGSAVPIKYGDGNGYLSVNGQDVWMEIGAPGMANALPAQLFASTDGGLTFHLVTQSAQSPGAQSTFPGFGPVVFLDASHGFTSAVHGGMDGLGLYQTTDGGKTWSAVNLPGGAQQAGLPVFSGHNGLVWAIQASSASNPTPVLFSTTDGGASWKAQQIPLGSDSVATNYDVFSGTGAVVGGMSGNVYSTSDGGATWNTVQPGSDAKTLLASNVMTSVSFSSSQVGWALMGPKGTALQSQTLYLTTDGGQSWTQVAK